MEYTKSHAYSIRPIYQYIQTGGNKRHQATFFHHLKLYLAVYMWRAAVTAEGRAPFNMILTDLYALPAFHNSLL